MGSSAHMAWLLLSTILEEVPRKEPETFLFLSRIRIEPLFVVPFEVPVGLPRLLLCSGSGMRGVSEMDALATWPCLLFFFVTSLLVFLVEPLAELDWSTLELLREGNFISAALDFFLASCELCSATSCMSTLVDSGSCVTYQTTFDVFCSSWPSPGSSLRWPWPSTPSLNACLIYYFRLSAVVTFEFMAGVEKSPIYPSTL